MKTILGIVLVISTAVMAEPESKLNTLVTIDTMSALPATDVLGFIAHSTGLTVDYADNVKTNGVRFRFQADSLPAGELLNWTLHFLDSHATFDNGVIHIADGFPAPVPAGKPVAKSEELAKPFSQSNTFTLRADHMIDYIVHFAKISNMVMGADPSQLKTEIHLNPNGRSTADILEDICNQAGLQCSLHGKVLIIKKKDNRELPIELQPDKAKTFYTPGMWIGIVGTNWALQVNGKWDWEKLPTGTLSNCTVVLHRGANMAKYIRPPAGPPTLPIPRTDEYTSHTVTNITLTAVGGRLAPEPNGYLEVSASNFEAGGEWYQIGGVVRLPFRGPYP